MTGKLVVLALFATAGGAVDLPVAGCFEVDGKVALLLGVRGNYVRGPVWSGSPGLPCRLSSRHPREDRESIPFPDGSSVLLRDNRVVFRSPSGEETQIATAKPGKRPYRISATRIQIGDRCYERIGNAVEVSLLPTGSGP